MLELLAYKYKAIVYEGMAVLVPDWVNYIAVDPDGGVFGYETAPAVSKTYWAGGGRYFHMGMMKTDEELYEQWRESLCGAE